MTFALIACVSLWTCAPEPLIQGLRLEHCRVLAVEMKVEGVRLKCERVK